MFSVALLAGLLCSLALQAKTKCAHELKDMNACAEVTWSLGPKYGIFSKAQVKLTNKDGSPFKEAGKLEVYPWMIMENGHEHGARETVSKVNPNGVIDVSMIQLMKMPGAWYLRLKKTGTKNSDHLVSIPIQVEDKK